MRMDEGNRVKQAVNLKMKGNTRVVLPEGNEC